MTKVGKIVKAILEEELHITCEEVEVHLRVLGKLRLVDDPIILLLSPYRVCQISVTQLEWKEKGKMRDMESIDLSAWITPSGRVFEDYKVVGPRDARNMTDSDLIESDENLSRKVRRALSRCVRRVETLRAFNLTEHES